jgi:uncharacterized repeat protein (TIGR01451 family)
LFARGEQGIERPSRRHLKFEPLEGRQLLASDLASLTGVVSLASPVVGATVNLYLDDGDGAFEGGGQDGAATADLTDATGAYRFDRLAAGSYWLEQPAQTVGTDELFLFRRLVTISAGDAAGTAGTVIDDFADSPAAEVESTSGTVSAVADHAGALGDERDMVVTLKSGTTTPAVTLTSSGNQLSFASSFDAQGLFNVIYDGDDGDAAALDDDGLAPTDLTQSGANSAIKIRAQADLAGATVRLRVYSDADNFSESAAVVIPSGNVAEDIVFHFATSFTGATGTGGPADFANVGAIDLLVETNTNGTDGLVTLLGAFAPNVVTQNLTSIDLSVDKSVDNPTPNVGQQVTFTLTLSNPAGGIDVAGIVVTDILPSGLDFDSATTATGSYDENTGLWTVGTLATGATATLDILATVTSSALLTNTASITAAGQPDSDPTNNGDSVDVDAPAEADLSLTIAPPTATPSQGQNATFTLTMLNSGPDAATNIVVTDVIPAGLVLQTSTPEAGTTYASNTWSIPSLASGEDVTLVVELRADDLSQLDYSAQVTASDLFDPDSTPNDGQGDDFDSSQVDAVAADLSLAITPPTQTPAVGQNATFTITLTNDGPDAAANIVVTDVLPTGLVFQSATPEAGTYDEGTKQWSVASLASGEDLTLTVVARVDSSALLTYNAQVTAAGVFDPDSTPNDGAGDDSASATVDAPPAADLSLTIDPPTATPAQGENATFTLTLLNSGPDAATNVVVTDVIPAGLVLQTSTPEPGTTYASNTWSIPTLASGEDVTLVIVLRADNTSELVYSAQVTASELADPDSTPNDAQGDDFDSSTVDVPPIADLSLAIAPPTATTAVGQNATFTITLLNSGPDAATNIVVTDVLPAGLVFQSATPEAGTYDDGTKQWSIPSLASGEDITLTVLARVDSSDLLTYSAQVTASGATDPDSTPNDGAGDDRATATVDAPPAADLSITNTPSSATPNFGTNVTYTVVVTNGGPDQATGVVVTDLLPAGLVFVSSNVSQGSYVSGTGVWTVGSINSGSTATLTLVARVNTTAAIDNVAQVTASGLADPDSTPNDNTGDDRAAATVDAPAAADLKLAKSATSGIVNVGQQVTFTVTVTNDGPDAATGVAVTDQLPAGLTFVSGNATIGTYDSGSGIWTVGTINNGQTATLTIVATLATAGAKINTAQVTASNEFDPDSSPNDNAGDDRATTNVTSALLSKRRFMSRP